MDNKDFELFLKIKEQLDRLNNIALTFHYSIEVDYKCSFSSNTYFLNINIPLDEYFTAKIVFRSSINNKFFMDFYFCFMQKCVDDYNNHLAWIQIVPLKRYVPDAILALGSYFKGRYNIVGNSISASGEHVIHQIYSNKAALSSMCKKSTCWDMHGNLKSKFTDWKSEAISLVISKEFPPCRIVTGIKKDQQVHYDNSYGLHGSNGTYVENVNQTWCLVFKVKRIGIEVDTSADFIIDIHKYITKKLMSQLGWGKITKERLEFLNNILKNKTLKVICRDLSIAPIYRNFVPLEYDNWETALDTILFKS
ncbi:hypothetical protein MUN53_13665 [Parabacteroides sp. AGMB00274]|uniref:Uncharacterized protein n=1 Tax=Parabacteroides faecalis TaxID=2924040 RepID=A0ABT0C3X6_9BACT|nr:hypothetical protein [Parabacteroides faecalis]MCJ2381640.1 hypothetical protein [Parabacteroides faecalis]